jgi:hypothetical protein
LLAVLATHKLLNWLTALGRDATATIRGRSGQAKRTVAGATSVRTSVKARLTWRPRRPASRRVGRRHTGRSRVEGQSGVSSDGDDLIERER